MKKQYVNVLLFKDDSMIDTNDLVNYIEQKYSNEMTSAKNMGTEQFILDSKNKEPYYYKKKREYVNKMQVVDRNKDIILNLVNHGKNFKQILKYIFPNKSDRTISIKYYLKDRINRWLEYI